MDNVFHEGDRLVIIHSYEWLSPAIPGQSNLFLYGGIVFWRFMAFFLSPPYIFRSDKKISVVSVLEMIASNAWEKQIEKRDKTVKSLEKKYRRRCKALKVRKTLLCDAV